MINYRQKCAIKKQLIIENIVINTEHLQTKQNFEFDKP